MDSFRRRSSRLPILLGCAILLILALFLARAPLLRAAGYALVNQDQLRKADVIVVLAGDYAGERILKACELARAGLAPVILVSGPPGFYGVNEADLAIRFAIAHGCPQGLLQPVYSEATSTEEEARVFREVLSGRGVHDAIIVTSNYHTARARRIFERSLRSGIRVQMAAAPARHFAPDSWWMSREGRKTFFYEVSKTLANVIGL